MKLGKSFSISDVIIFFSLIASWPCVFYLMGYLPDFKFNLLALASIAMAYIFFTKSYVVPSSLMLIANIQLITWLLYSIIHVDTSYITRMFYIFLAMLIVLIDFGKGGGRFLKIFVYWITLQSLLSAIGFILCILDIIHPFTYFDEMDGRLGYNFIIFTTNTYWGLFVRPAGFFDEPGALACWGVYALVLNRCFLKKKIVEYILLICLLFTLSIAFFIQACIFTFFFYRNNLKKIVISLIIVSFVMGYIISQDDVFYEQTIGRLVYDESEETISGDNRSDLRKNARTIFLQHPLIGVGGRNLFENHDDVIANEFTYLASDGILGQIVTWIPYVYLFLILGRSRRDVRYSVLVCAVGLLQRPYLPEKVERAIVKDDPKLLAAFLYSNNEI